MVNYTPATWAAGETPTANKMNTEIRDPLTGLQAAWDDYTPTLAAWTIGNGTLLGRVRQTGKSYEFIIDLTIGSTSGTTGSVGFSLPATPRDAASGLIIRGAAWLFDTSTSTHNYRNIASTGAGNVALRDDSGALVNGSTPWSWATGDRVYLAGSFEAA